MAQRWRCPFCNHDAVLTDSNRSTGRHEFNHGSKYGYQAVQTHAFVCPNPECKEYALTVTLHDHRVVSPGGYVDLDAKQTWRLRPAADVRVFPDYIPRAILDDYREACLIRDASPKASATLARRALQGMLRDFWSVKAGRLVDEIEAVRDRVDPLTWDAIDAVRKIGNIGAHMEKDINVIVDVDPQEAKLLIGLIETLLQDWYVTKHERQQRLAGIVSIANTKKGGKKPI
jgi:hypothetical protein